MSAPVVPTSRRVLLTGLAGAGIFGAAAPSMAQASLGDPAIPDSGGDYFLKLTGIPGPSVRDGHEDEIEPLTFNWKVSQQPGTKDAKPVLTVEALLFVAPWGIQSPLLFEHLVAARRIASAMLSARRTLEGETSDYLRISMTDCLVSSYQVTPNPVGGQVIEILELRFDALPTLLLP